MQLLAIQFTIKMFHTGFMQVLLVFEISILYVPVQHDSSIYIQTVYTATTADWPHQNCSKKIILAHFIVNRRILIFHWW